jgi:uncharacterized cupredoxin-like copper-binding protein
MRVRVFLLSLLVLAVGLSVAPVAFPQSAKTNKTVVTVTAKEWRFVLSASSVKAGPVVFKVTNKGKLGHDFSISGKKTPVIAAGKSATLTVTLTKGAKPYKCTVPGHAAAGMKGVLKVT